MGLEGKQTVASEICPRWGVELPADAPERLCPECLLRRSVEALGAGLVAPGDTADYDGGFAPPAAADLADHFPHLEILELVGRGGMGAVYRARQPGLDRLVAVKLLPPEVARDPAFAERFSREARSLALFNHPNIVTIHEIESVDGVDYIAMEYVRGSTLRELIPPGGMTFADALNYASQIAAGMAAARSRKTRPFSFCTTRVSATRRAKPA